MPDDTTPHIARIHNYWLGGNANFAADRAAAHDLAARFHGIDSGVRDARRFLARALLYVAWRGIRDFIDLGIGIPTDPQVHHLVRAQAPDARVAYVDSDPVSIAYASVLDSHQGIAVLRHDIRQPDAVLDDTRLRRLIRLREPVCVILNMVLHLMHEADAAATVKGFMQRVPAGSYVVLSCGAPVSYAHAASLTASYVAPLFLHDRAALEDILAGLELVEPGITDVRGWWAGLPGVPQPQQYQSLILGAVARKP